MTSVTGSPPWSAEGLVDRRATFTEWNVWAETARATRGLRMTSLAERVDLVERVVAAGQVAVRPTGPTGAHVFPSSTGARTGPASSPELGRRGTPTPRCSPLSSC